MSALEMRSGSGGDGAAGALDVHSSVKIGIGDGSAAEPMRLALPAAVAGRLIAKSVRRDVSLHVGQRTHRPLGETSSNLMTT